MSPHDALMSALVVMRKQLEEYLDEFDPPTGTMALDHLCQAMILASRFADDDEEQKRTYP